jgi:hypothetical protein
MDISEAILNFVHRKKKNKNLTKIPFSILYLEALIYIAVIQAFSMVPNNRFNRGRDPAYVQFCVCDVLTKGTG